MRGMIGDNDRRTNNHVLGGFEPSISAFVYLMTAPTLHLSGGHRRLQFLEYIRVK
jgi:hypothetical protein